MITLKKQKELLQLIKNILEEPDIVLSGAGYGYKAAVRDILQLVEKQEEQENDNALS